MIHICPKCKKEFKGRKEQKYCSNSCKSKATSKFSEMNKANTGKTYEEIYGIEKAKLKKEKLSKVQSKPLIERGWTQEKIDEYRKWMAKEILGPRKGKSFEDIFGNETAKEAKEKMSKKASGEDNAMSLQSIANRNDCSLEEAHFIAPAYGRIGELHPMFGEHHSIDSKIKMMKTFEKNGTGFSKFFSCGYLDNIFWQGTWELKYLSDCKEQGIIIKRYDLKPFEYNFNGLKHHYFPDFIINENTIVEIKGYDIKAERTIYKMNKFMERYDNLLIITDIDIGTSAKLFLRLMKEKYGNRLDIKHNPHEKELNESN